MRNDNTPVHFVLCKVELTWRWSASWRLPSINSITKPSFSLFTPLRRNLKKEFSLWRRIKCIPSTLRRRNLKTNVSFWERIEYFPSTLSPEEYKNTANDRPFWICVFGKLGKRNHVIIVTSLFSKFPFSKRLRPHETTKPAFSNSPGLKGVSVRSIACFSLSSLWFTYKMRPIRHKFTTAAPNVADCHFCFYS